jgi:Trypsin-like peptidase domain/NACHT domain
VDENLVDQALVRICDAGGHTRGTGFFIGEGTILTCHHVVDGLADVVARIGDRDVEVASSEEERLSALDVAMLRCDTDELQSVLPLGLALPAAPSVWAKGFQYAALMPEAVPLSGTVSGRTAVAYTARRSYELTGVLALGGLTVDAGTSGAPLLDREWGVVIGMVNTRFNLPGGLTGFALPLRDVVTASERVATLIDRNRRRVPAYGPYLNVAAARATCSAALRDAMRRFVDRELILEDRYCARPRVAAMIDEFFAGEDKLLPIVGASGTGKTTELAALARRESLRHPVLLVPCAELDGPVEEGLLGNLGRILGRTVPDAAAVDAVLGQLEDDGAELLILLDALNDVPGHVAVNERSWLAATFEWVRRHRVRLLVTCRPDHWELVARLFPPDLAPKEPARIDDFSQTEASEALRRYELTSHGLEPDDVRHPLLVRIYWQLDVAGAKLSRYEALAEFSARLCADAALDAGLPVPSVRAALSAVAARTARHGVLVLPIDEVAALDGPPLQALVRRNILLDAPAGLRFAFDELGEWQQAQHVAPSDLASARTGTAAFALLRLEREQGAEALVEPLERLLANVPGDNRVNRVNQIDFVLEQVVEELENPVPVAPVLARWIDRIVADRPIADFLAAGALRRAAMPVARRFELLGRLAGAESEWDWRHKRWRDLPALVVGSSMPSAGGVAAELLREDPATAIECLIRWFDNQAREPGHATPDEVARGLLLHHCALGFEQICDSVASRGTQELSYLFDLAAADPDRMASVCARWCASEDRERQLLGSACARKLVLDPGTLAAARAAASAVLEGAIDRADPMVRAEALVGLYARDETRELVATEVLDTFRNSGSPFSAYVVASGLRTHHDEVLDAMLGVITDSGRSDRANALRALTHQPLTTPDLERVIRNLDDVWLHAPLSLDLGRWLEESLYRLTSDDPIADALLTVARRSVIGGDENVRACVAYATTSIRRTDAEIPWGRDLFALLLGAAPPEECARLIGAVAGNVRVHPWIADVFVDRAGRADADDLDVLLLAQACRASFGDFGDELAAALRRRGGLPPTQRLGAFADLVGIGVPVGGAAARALEHRS